MKGYFIRNIGGSYTGIDSMGNQDWLDHLSGWNMANTDSPILIDEAVEAFMGKGVALSHVLRFFTWLKSKAGYEQSKLLFFDICEAERSCAPERKLIGYDVAFMRDPEYQLENYFYSSIYHELLSDRLGCICCGMRVLRNRLNSNGLFSNISDAREYLVMRNKEYLIDTHNLFETAFETNYDVVAIYALPTDL